MTSKISKILARILNLPQKPEILPLRTVTSKILARILKLPQKHQKFYCFVTVTSKSIKKSLTQFKNEKNVEK
jgi:hypothetical protein